MQPLIPNSSSKNCGNPTSSNCVNWNSTNPPCINVCNGDSVGDVIYKLGQELCYFQGLLDLSALDLSCCYTPCPSCQQPTKLEDVLQIMMNCICAQSTQIATLQTQVNSLTAGTATAQ